MSRCVTVFLPNISLRFQIELKYGIGSEIRKETVSKYKLYGKQNSFSEITDSKNMKKSPPLIVNFYSSYILSFASLSF